MKTTIIMMMAVLSSEGWCSAISTARVDFPKETPGYKGTVTVTGDKDTSSPHKNLESAKNGDEFTWIQVPYGTTNADIYFPVDGSQPTTPDAVKWSCANIDNNPKSPITEWYMRMFGWTKTPWYMRMFGWTNSSEETPLKMGFSPLTPQESDKLHKEWENRIKNVFDPNTPLIDPDLHITQEPTPIITFDESMDKNNQQQFWEEIFRETASVSVGRILLYRLLLEIRRTQDGVGALDLGVPERKKFADVFRILFGANASTYDNSSNPSYSQLKNDLESEIFSLLQELGESSEKLQDFLSPSKKLQDSLSPSRDSGDSLSFVDTVNKLTSPIPALLDNAQKLESKISTAIEELEKKRLKDLEEKFDLQDNFNSKELQDLLSSSEDSDDSCSFGDTVNNLTSPIHALLDIVDDTKTKLIFPIDSLSDIVDDIRTKLIFPIDSLLNQVNNLALLGKSITSCSNIIMQDSKALQEKFKSLDEFLPEEESTQNWSSLLSFPLTFFPEIVEELQTKIQSIQNDAKSVREYEKSIKEHLQKKTLELQDMRSIQDNLKSIQQNIKSIQSRVGFISECRVDPVSSTVKIIQQNVKAIQPGLKIQLSNFPSYYSLFKERSQARSICIINRANISNFFGFHIPTPNDFIWRYSHNTRKGSSCIGISFDPICKIATKVYQNDHGQLETGWETTPLSVYLCHEMLHWFHELRSPLRYLEEDANIVKSTSIETSTLSPLISLYFKPYIPSSQDWSNEIWSGDEFGYPQKKTEIKKAFPNLTQYGEKEGDTAIRGEEMRTVLGSHYSVTDYLEGDDLSENLFSCSLNYYFFQRDIKQQAAMRYGHSFRVIKAQHDSQIRLAHQVVLDSMNLITPEACQYWELKEGKALISKNWKNEFKKSMGDDDYNRLIRLDRWNRFLRIPPQFGSSALDQIESPTLDQTQNRSSRSRNFLMNLVELRDMFTIAILAYLYHQMFTELI